MIFKRGGGVAGTILSSLITYVKSEPRTPITQCVESINTSDNYVTFRVILIFGTSGALILHSIQGLPLKGGMFKNIFVFYVWRE